MTLRFFNTSIVGAATAITAATNDTIYIEAGTSIVSTSNRGIAAASGASNISIEVNGTVAGAVLGIDFSGASPSGSNMVTVGATGRVIGELNNTISFSGGAPFWSTMARSPAMEALLRPSSSRVHAPMFSTREPSPPARAILTPSISREQMTLPPTR
jgi:hypothetical protein